MSRLTKRINDMLKYESDWNIANIDLKKEVSEKLLSYQYLHVFNLISALQNTDVVLDGSDTGTGKTYTAIAVCKQLRLNPIIVCPKIVVSKWGGVCDLFGVKPLAIVNYETFRNGKQYDEHNKRVESKFLKIDSTSKSSRFTWSLPRYSVIIFDEVHRCKNLKSINGELLRSTRDLTRIQDPKSFISSKEYYKASNRRDACKIIMLSATIADTPKSFHIFGYMLGLYKSMRQANNWIKGMLREDSCYIGTQKKASSINTAIFPFKGSRMIVADLGDKFPKNQVVAECYNLDEKSKKEIDNTLIDITDNLIKGCKLEDLVAMRQKLELLKIPVFKSLIEEYLDNNYSVVVFVNFTQTLKTLADMFDTECLLYGELTSGEQERNIEAFQENRDKLIICNIKVGGIGISLHDTYGGNPRVSLISPTFSSIDLIQALGRICRAGSKSPALQRIVYTADTCEEVICKRINKKFEFTNKIVDDGAFNDNIDLDNLDLIKL